MARMRRMTLITIATFLLATAAAADTAKNCSFMWFGTTAANPMDMKFPDFMDMCLADSYRVPAAWNNSTRPPIGVTGKCKDGAWTTEPTHQDACITHGGVYTWYRRY